MTHDELFYQAVQAFWDVRAAQMRKQQDFGRVDAGTRGAVTGGAQMDQMAALLVDLVEETGLTRLAIHHTSALELPGFFRAEKKWDILVISEGELLAAIEMKSQVGPSFGNNFNNRSEEAIGSATCLWTAYREGRFGHQQRPFLGYLFLLEDCPKVHEPVKVRQPHFLVDPTFVAASYSLRYELLCRRLVRERLYDSACLALATNSSPTRISQPADDLTFKQFAISLQERIRAFLRARQ